MEAITCERECVRYCRVLILEISRQGALFRIGLESSSAKQVNIFVHICFMHGHAHLLPPKPLEHLQYSDRSANMESIIFSHGCNPDSRDTISFIESPMLSEKSDQQKEAY